MPIVAGDIQFRHSGGASNTDPNADLGGAISNTALTDNTDNNLFDDISGAESAAGDVEYRCIYVRNGHASLTLQNARIYVSQDSQSDIDIALGGEGMNGTAETIANESTAPSGETFSHPIDYAGGLSLGNLTPSSHYPIWVRRTIAAAQVAVSGYTFKLKVEGDTAA